MDEKFGPKGPFKLYEWPPLDWKIDQWQTLMNIGVNVGNNIYNIKSPNLSEIIGSFITNTINFCSLSALPGGLFASGRSSQLAEVAACMELHQKPVPDQPCAIVPPEIAALRDDYMEARKQPPFPILTGASTEMAFDLSLRFFQVQFRTLMISQIILCWTTFETLAGDLWEAALNAHPNELSDLNGTNPEKMPKSKKTPSALVYTDEDKKTNEKNIRLQFIRDHKYDLSRLMGTILRERYNFQTLASIQLAYIQAFGNSHSAVRDAILHPSLMALAAIRNALVHRAGIVDQGFMDEYKSSPELRSIFPVIEMQKPLPIDGKSVHDLVEQVVAQAVKLINAVGRVVDTNEGNDP